MQIKEEILEKTNKAILHRANLFMKASNNPDLQAIEIESCRQDILYFFENYLYTDRNPTIYNNDYPDDLPFIPYRYQIEYIDEVWESIVEGNKPVLERKPGVFTDVFVEKSRQMGISWLTCGIFLYGFLFHKHKYVIISRTAEEVDVNGDMDSMFEKIRYMIRNLPQWMLPEGFSKDAGRNSTNAYMKITDLHSQASITGKTANPNAGRGGTRHATFMDEMAAMDYATQICSAVGSASGCVIYNSTPNGEGNEFYRKRKLTTRRKQQDGTFLEPEIKGLRFHWKDHPLYDDAWYRAKILGKTPEQVAAEYEINYNVAIRGRVYKDFPADSTMVTYDPNKPLYIAIDNSHGGVDPHAVILAQLDNHLINVIDSIAINCSVTDMAEFMSGAPKFELGDYELNFLERYKKYNRKRATFILDPYDTHSAMNNTTISKEYRKVGINVFTPSERDKKMQIAKTKSNIYRIQYNDYCLDFASAMMNSKYPEVKEGSNRTTPADIPVHDQRSHYRTACEYLVNYLLENPVANKPRVPEDTRVYKDGYGQMVYPKKDDLFKPQPVNLQFNNL